MKVESEVEAREPKAGGRSQERLGRIVRSLKLLGITVALLVPLLVAGAPAQASTRCHDDQGHFTCYGLDPIQIGCSADANTASQTSFWSTSQSEWVTIELRYSSACQANWAKISPAPEGWQFYVQDGWGNRVYETVKYSNSFWYGNMVDGRRTAGACFLNDVCTWG